MRQRLRIHPPSQNFTSVYLTCSLRNSLLNTLISKGCYRLFKWAMHAGFFVSTWGGGGVCVYRWISLKDSVLPSLMIIYLCMCVFVCACVCVHVCVCLCVCV